MNVFVTGGAGYIGSHACKALARAGYQPVVYDNLSRGHRELVRWGDLVVGDVRDGAKLREALRHYRPAAVLHFAALAYVGESVSDPAPYFENNSAGTIELLAAMRDCGVQNIVFSSTCATYGIPARVPIVENTPQQPMNPYGWSKLFVERILRSYGEAYGLNSVILRYFNACGADPDAEIGELHEPETHLIPRALLSTGDGPDELEIYGTDYPTRDGTCVRDYIHVSDLADFHTAAVRYAMEGNRSATLNLGIGAGFTVREVIRAVERVTGLAVRARECPRRAGDPPELVADGSLACQVLNVRPRFTDLVEIIQTAWTWHCSTTRRKAQIAAA
jgi:UDP-glucose-4-epimerase GalE